MQNQSPTCMDWLDLLTAHETRHMVQESKIHNEMPGILRFGIEKKLHSTTYLYREGLSVKDSLAVWVENRPNARWAFADKTRLRMLNLNTGKSKTY